MSSSASSVTAKPVAQPVAKPVEKAPVTSTTTGASPTAGADTKPVAKADATPVKDDVKLSTEAGATKEGDKAKAANPYEGVADKSSEVTVDPYKKGKNDTLEGMLRNQGYSLQDIYNKGKDGKTLIDHVASVNNLKNPNVIQDGAKLQIPGRDNSESLSSMDLKPGEAQTSEVENKKAGVSAESEMKKAKDGSTTLDVKGDNKKNPDAELSTKTKVEDGGRIDTNSTATKDGVKTNTVAQNKDGSAVNQVTEKRTPEQTSVDIKDIDKRGDNSKVVASNDSVSVVNPGSKKAGDVTTNVDISEKSSDGLFENGGRWVAEKFGYKGEEKAPVSVDNVGAVNVTKNAEGQATVTTEKDGKKTEILKTAGDTDDTLLERAGEVVDDGIRYVGDGIASGAGAVADTAKSAWNGLSDWWNGTSTPAPNKDVKTEKSGIFGW